MEKNDQVVFLNEMVREFDQELISELVQIYCLQMDDFFLQMKNIRQNFNSDQVMMAAHKLKSSARNIGAFDVAKLFQGLETSPEIILHPGVLERLLSTYKTSVQNIESWHLARRIA